jgi:hypothetical protein
VAIRQFQQVVISSSICSSSRASFLDSGILSLLEWVVSGELTSAGDRKPPGGVC